MRKVTVSISVGPSPRDRALARLARGLVDREDVVAVDADAGHAVGDAPCRRRWRGRLLLRGTEMAQWLFSQTKTHGAFQTPAKFIPAWNSPSTGAAVAEVDPAWRSSRRGSARRARCRRPA